MRRKGTGWWGDLILLVVAVGCAITLFAVLKSRGTRSEMNACINNLRQIDSAREQWALQYNKGMGDIPGPMDISPYVRNGTNRLVCPAGGKTFDDSYIIGAMSNNPRCKVHPKTHVF